MKRILLILALLTMFPVLTVAQGNAFSFQGRLNDGTSPANGAYDLEFRLFPAIQGGTPIAATASRPNTTLINGVFSVTLDFGATAFNNSNAVFIEIAVRPNGSPNAYTVLGPRQQLTVVPFAVRAMNSTNADNAGNAEQLGGIAASQYITTPTAGNTLIRNDTAQQTSANFNIDGNGTVGSLAAEGTVSIVGSSPPATAPPGQVRIYFDAASNKVKVSENQGVFVDLVGSGGVSGSGTTSNIPLWSGGTTLGNSQITQSANGVQLPTNVQLAPTAQGNQIQFGQPNGETGMSISGASGRADVRFDGTTLKLLAGPAGSPPTNGIAVTASAVQLPANIQLAPTTQGNQVQFGSPNGEAGMSISGATGRADVRFDGSTLRLLSGPAGTPPVKGIEILATGDVKIGTAVGAKLSVSTNANQTGISSESSAGIGVQANSSTNIGVQGTSTTNFGVFGKSVLGHGVKGEGDRGVFGFSSTNVGVYGLSNAPNGTGVFGETSGTAGNEIAIHGRVASGGGLAGYFQGPVSVEGRIDIAGNVNANDIYANFGLVTGNFVAGHFIETSDRNAKSNLAAVDPRSTLRKVAALPIQIWNYKSQPASVRHIGPMAQDFRAAFGLGEDDKHIAPLDTNGVALASIQGLYLMLIEQNKQITKLRKQLNQLQRAVRRH